MVSFKNKKLLARRLTYAGTKCCFDGLGVNPQNGSDIAIGNFDADANIELIITDHLKDQDSMAVEVYKTDNNYIYCFSHFINNLILNFFCIFIDH